jgi:hypothetical protein
MKTNEITSDPLMILIEKEEDGEMEVRRQEREDTEVYPCLVPIPNSYNNTSADPLQLMLDQSDPEKNLRAAIVN